DVEPVQPRAPTARAQAIPVPASGERDATDWLEQPDTQRGILPAPRAQPNGGRYIASRGSSPIPRGETTMKRTTLMGIFMASGAAFAAWAQPPGFRAPPLPEGEGK